jgi:hypothetical protein
MSAPFGWSRRQQWSVWVFFGLTLTAAVLLNREIPPLVVPEPPAAKSAQAGPAPDLRRFESDPDFTPMRFSVAYPPITEFPVVKVREADDALNPSELVLGVTIQGQSRAYPINRITGPTREVLNDRLGGVPIAMTWCDNCFDGIVYSRDVNGQILTFGISGMMWDFSGVLYDQETESLWSQVLGVAKRGLLRGKSLTPIPSVLTDWKTWALHYPESTVALLGPTSTEFQSGKNQSLVRFVLGVQNGRLAKAWGFDVLARTQAFSDNWDGRPVLAVLDRSSFTARLYSREIDGRAATFRADQGKLTDLESKSTWDPVTGMAIAGPLTGRSLVALPAVVFFREAWLRFHPGSEITQPAN